MWDKIEEFVKIAWLIILSIFAPIKIAVIALLFFFTLDFFIGFKNDQIVHNRDFSLKKATTGGMLLALFFVLIYVVNIALSVYEETSLAESASKFLSWFFCYWYLVNTLRNSTEIFPESKALKVLYSILTVQVFDMILGRFGLKRPDDL